MLQHFGPFAKNFQEASKLLDQACKMNEVLKEYIALFEVCLKMIVYSVPKNDCV